jgi:hypothetical protein
MEKKNLKIKKLKYYNSYNNKGNSVKIPVVVTVAAMTTMVAGSGSSSAVVVPMVAAIEVIVTMKVWCY